MQYIIIVSQTPGQFAVQETFLDNEARTALDGYFFLKQNAKFKACITNWTILGKWLNLDMLHYFHIALPRQSWICCQDLYFNV